MLNGCSSLSDELVSQISRVLFNLQELDLSSCLHVTDIGLSAITGSLVNLHSLRLSWCVNITDNGLIGFVQSEQNLAHVCHNKEKCSHAEKFKNDVNINVNQVHVYTFCYFLRCKDTCNDNDYLASQVCNTHIAIGSKITVSRTLCILLEKLDVDNLNLVALLKKSFWSAGSTTDNYAWVVVK